MHDSASYFILNVLYYTLGGREDAATTLVPVTAVASPGKEETKDCHCVCEVRCSGAAEYSFRIKSAAS